MTTTVNGTLGDWNGTTLPVVYDTTMASTDVDSNSSIFPDASSTPTPHPHDSIWLMSASAQGIAGVFVWAAVFITCHQVFSLATFLVKALSCDRFHFLVADLPVSEVLHSPL